MFGDGRILLTCGSSGSNVRPMLNPTERCSDSCDGCSDCAASIRCENPDCDERIPAGESLDVPADDRTGLPYCSLACQLYWYGVRFLETFDHYCSPECRAEFVAAAEREVA